MGVATRLHGLDFPSGPLHAVFSKQLVRRPDAVSKKVYAVTNRRNLMLAEPHVHFRQRKLFDPFNVISHPWQVIAQNNYIIHVARPMAVAEFKMNKPINHAAVDVGEHLTC